MIWAISATQLSSNGYLDVQTCSGGHGVMSGAEYSRALARVAVAQIAELAGFDAAHDSAVDILGDLLQRYIANVCTSAHEYAESAGRTHTNTMDALLALEDLGVTPDELDVFTGLMLQVRGRRSRESRDPEFLDAALA